VTPDRQTTTRPTAGRHIDRDQFSPPRGDGKAIYEELHPETKQHVAGGLARQGAASADSAFAESTSEATGKSRRSVETAAARGEALGDDLKAVEKGERRWPRVKQFPVPGSATRL
jgi:hypothetical protein